MNKRPVLSVLLGIIVTGCMFRFLGSGSARILLFPATLLLAAGLGPNIGSPEHPIYEFTPVHLIAIMTGLGISALMYSGLIYLYLKKIAPQWN
jgi:hypothetical protein